MSEPQYTNHLIHETSPYLLQHAHNPVDWYPWGEAAFEKARKEDKPILLSCGYSACHWCHVMERESFEDPEIAKLMNDYFVNVKVDREERPDIDQLYQDAMRALTMQGGGWPLTVFMDCEGNPFFGGTYFPPRPMYGRSSFPELLQLVHQKWVDERDTVLKAGTAVGRYLQDAQQKPGADVQLPDDLAAQACKIANEQIDRQYGGFGNTPKFPNPSLLQMMLVSGVLHGQADAIDSVLLTLEKMASGGVYDQLGGGFHRYSTDRFWRVPHFEKMLYDNAQLLKLYAIGYQFRPCDTFQKVVEETVAYLVREMQSPEGGFYATQDADSEGVEGKFFVWRWDELQRLLTTEEFDTVRRYYGVSETGNFEGANILNRLNLDNPSTEAKKQDATLLESAKRKLFTAREKREKPFLDQKIITSWNGLTISGLAYAYQVFGRTEYYQAARTAAECILSCLKLEDGGLARIFKDGQAKVAAMLDDYAFLAQGLLDLYEADFEPRWLEESMRLTGLVRHRFGSAQGIYYLVSGVSGESLVARPVSCFDQAIPSGVAAHCGNLMKLAALSGVTQWQEEAEQILKAYTSDIAANALECAGLVTQFDLFAQGLQEFVFLSPNAEIPEMVQNLRKVYLPNRIIAWSKADAGKLEAHPAQAVFTGRNLVNDTTTCYICTKQQCRPPVTAWEELRQAL